MRNHGDRDIDELKVRVEEVLASSRRQTRDLEFVVNKLKSLLLTGAVIPHAVAIPATVSNIITQKEMCHLNWHLKDKITARLRKLIPYLEVNIMKKNNRTLVAQVEQGKIFDGG